MKILFVVNPISGGIDKEPFLKDASTLCHVYGILFKVFKTTGQEDEVQLQELLKTYKPDKVISVGGDGTTLFTAIALLNSGVPMGIVPLGSANGMAIELFVPNNPLKALKDIIMSQITGDLDVLLVNKKHYSIHIGDVGVNAQVVSGYDSDENRGMVTYAKYFFEALNKAKPFNMKIKTDDKYVETKGVMVAICNARKYGTGVPLNRKGNPMDGKFELVIVEKIDANVLIKAGLSSLNDDYFPDDQKTVLSTACAKIEFDSPMLLQLDGEIKGEFKTLNIELLKGAVKLITTSKNTYL